MDMQEIALKRSISTLKALNCKFLIITAQGEKFGELEIEQPHKPHKHKHGELRSYVGAYLKDIQVGQDFTVPCDEYDMKTTVKAITNWFTCTYGTGSLRYKTDKYANCVHGIRI